jgi:hypothetical protein
VFISLETKKLIQSCCGIYYDIRCLLLTLKWRMRISSNKIDYRFSFFLIDCCVIHSLSLSLIQSHWLIVLLLVIVVDWGWWSQRMLKRHLYQAKLKNFISR